MRSISCWAPADNCVECGRRVVVKGGHHHLQLELHLKDAENLGLNRDHHPSSSFGRKDQGISNLFIRS